MLTKNIKRYSLSSTLGRARFNYVGYLIEPNSIIFILW